MFESLYEKIVISDFSRRGVAGRLDERLYCNFVAVLRFLRMKIVMQRKNNMLRIK